MTNNEMKTIILQNDYRTATISLLGISSLDISLQIIMNCEADIFTGKIEFNIPKLIEIINIPYEQLFLDGFEYIFTPGICVDEFGDYRLCLKVIETFDDTFDDTIDETNSYVILVDSDNMCELADMMENSESAITDSILSESPTITTYSSYEEVDSFIPLIDFTYFIQCK